MQQAEAAGAIWHPSPNFGVRRGGAEPCLVVVHYTAMATADAALARLCAPEYEVSAHYLIGRDGRLWQLVAEAQRAWHAGVGAWGSISDVNSASIGVEIDNPGDAPFAEAAMARLEQLLPEIYARWDIGPGALIGHADCAPERKDDPGPRFDWRRLARQGLAFWPEPAADASGDVARLLERVGYSAEAPVAAKLAAFRARYRQAAFAERAPVEAADRALLASMPPPPAPRTRPMAGD
ncbi:MAG: N-acetylmuramoyl-L-alanine amidase [Pseudomonadota bacterium]